MFMAMGQREAPILSFNQSTIILTSNK